MKILGKVIKGKGLGYKTANLKIESRNLLNDLADGVYLAKVFYKDIKYPAIAIKGVRQDLEVRLLDFEGDLYSQFLEVEILEKMRNLAEFNDKEKLFKKIDEDIKRAKELFHR